MSKPLPPYGPVLVENNATANAVGRRSSRKSSTPGTIRPAGMQVVGIIQSNASVNPRPGVKSGNRSNGTKAPCQKVKIPPKSEEVQSLGKGAKLSGSEDPRLTTQPKRWSPAGSARSAGASSKLKGKKKARKFQFGQGPRHQTLLTECCLPCGEVIVVVLYRRRGLSSRSRSRSLRRACELPLCPV